MKNEGTLVPEATRKNADSKTAKRLPDFHLLNLFLAHRQALERDVITMSLHATVSRIDWFCVCVYACMRVLVIVRNERSLCMCFVLCLIYVFVYSVYKTVCAHMHSPSHMCLYTLSTCHTPSSVFVSLLYTLFAWAGAKRR